MPITRRRLLGASLASLGVAHAPAFAQAWPTRSVHLICPYGAGGSSDILTRMLADALSTRLGQTFVVENKVGAGTRIANEFVARAAPDGYTLLFGVAANLAVGPATMKSPPYDPTRAFTPIVEVSRGPYLFMVRADAPARTMKEFIEWTRANPGRANYASPGQGSVHHLATEMFKQKTGADLSHVPYKGGAALTAALLSGEVHGLFDSPTAYLSHLRAGTIRALAVTGDRRLAALPEVPTLAEQGLPTLDVHSWWGFVGPAGMPPEIVAKLNAEITKALGDPELKATLAKLGTEPTPGTPEAFRDYIAREWARWREFVATSGLKF